MKQTLAAMAGLMLACSGIAARGAESAQESDYRASEFCVPDWVRGTAQQEPRLVVHAIDAAYELKLAAHEERAITLTLHPEILGRPHRADVLRRVLDLATGLALRPVTHGELAATVG